MTTLAESPVGESNCLHLPLPTPVTDEQLIKINDRNPGWKIERGANGELEARMVAGGSSSDIAAHISAFVVFWRLGGGGGRARESDGTYNLRDADDETRTWAPDVSWVSPEQLAETAPKDRPHRGFWNLCPAFVVEVRSPNDARNQQQRRMAQWLRFGVKLGWLVDPIEETVSIYRPDAEPEMLPRPSELSGESVLNGLVVDLTEVWTFVDEDNAND